MRKHLICSFPGGIASLAWLSFQPDGAVSFGLHDRTFRSPRVRVRIPIFNADNRVTANYIIQSEPKALEPVTNPHFTYHPIAMFHLRANGDEVIFEGLADTTVVLLQQPEMPWIRAITAGLSTLRPSGARPDGIASETWTMHSSNSEASVAISVDLLNPPPPQDHDIADCFTRHIEWHGIVVRVKAATRPEQIATLAWFHAA